MVGRESGYVEVSSNWRLRTFGWLVRWLFDCCSKFETIGRLPIRLLTTFWPWTQKLFERLFDNCLKFGWPWSNCRWPWLWPWSNFDDLDRTLMFESSDSCNSLKLFRIAEVWLAWCARLAGRDPNGHWLKTGASLYTKGRYQVLPPRGVRRV